MSDRLSQEKLEEMVVGKSENPNAVFFEHAELDVERSKAAGRRMYNKVVYIKLSQPGVTDSMSYPAKKEDIAKYSDEYAYFLQNKQGKRRPGIDIIPNLDIAHLQELRDYGILTIPQLAEMVTVPPHLEYAYKAAKVFNAAIEEMEDDEQKDEKQEKELTPAQKVGFKTRSEAESEVNQTERDREDCRTVTGSQGRVEEEPLEGEIMPPQDRLKNSHDVRPSRVPDSDSGRQERETPQRGEASGRARPRYRASPSSGIGRRSRTPSPSQVPLC